MTKLLKLLAGELSSVVQTYVPCCPIVNNILPQSVYNVCGIFSFKREKSKEPAVMVHNCKSIPRAMAACYHISHVSSYPLQWFVHRRKFLPLLLSASLSLASLTSYTFFDIHKHLHWDWPNKTSLQLFWVFFWSLNDQITHGRVVKSEFATLEEQ